MAIRNPDRIPRMLSLLEEIWKLDPQLRLAQILAWEARGMDLFYVEDDVMEERLKARLKVERMVKRG